MTNLELRQIQNVIGFDAPSMAACLGVTERCYRNYLYGVNTIPSKIERAALELKQINNNFMAEAPARIDARISREFPMGVPNEANRTGI